MFGYDVFGSPAIRTFASEDNTVDRSYFHSHTPWQRPRGGQWPRQGSSPRIYQMKSVTVDEPDPYNPGQTRRENYMLAYVWPDLSSYDDHYVRITKGPRSVLWTKQLGSMDSSVRTQSWNYSVIDDIVSNWNSIMNGLSNETCNTEDTYLGATVLCNDGGSRCLTNEDSYVAGDIVPVASALRGSYTMKTVPDGIVICPGTLDTFTPCGDNEMKALGYSFSNFTTGYWTCAKEAGCPDRHNVDYKSPDLGYRDDYAACGDDCIAGAAKRLLGSGNGSCIRKIDEWNDGTGDNAMVLALGESGHPIGQRWIVAFENADINLDYKTYSGGSKSFPTEAEALEAYNKAAARRKAILNPPEEPDDDGNPTCTDTKRQTNSDGSCAANCISGHDFNVSGMCEEVVGKKTDLTSLFFFGGLALASVLVLRS